MPSTRLVPAQDWPASDRFLPCGRSGRDRIHVAVSRSRVHATIGGGLPLAAGCHWQRGATGSLPASVRVGRYLLRHWRTSRQWHPLDPSERCRLHCPGPAQPRAIARIVRNPPAQMPLGLRACLRSPIRAAFCEGGAPGRLEGTAFTDGGSDRFRACQTAFNRLASHARDPFLRLPYLLLPGPCFLLATPGPFQYNNPEGPVSGSGQVTGIASRHDHSTGSIELYAVSSSS